MSWISTRVAGIGHRVLLAYQLTCAREAAREQGMSLPLGAWQCEHCEFVTWDQEAFITHCRVHSA